MEIITVRNSVKIECETFGVKNKPTGDFDKDLPAWMESWRLLNGKRPFDEALAIAYTRSLYVGDERNSRIADKHIASMSTIPESMPDDLRKARCPFLAIHGTEDLLVPVDNGMALANLVPSGKLHLLNDAGHMFFNLATWNEIFNVIIPHFRNCH
jgi:pimeloyl-ACP methyl ester carboxylesterase